MFCFCFSCISWEAFQTRVLAIAGSSLSLLPTTLIWVREEIFGIALSGCLVWSFCISLASSICPLGFLLIQRADREGECFCLDACFRWDSWWISSCHFGWFCLMLSEGFSSSHGGRNSPHRKYSGSPSSANLLDRGTQMPCPLVLQSQSFPSDL